MQSLTFTELTHAIVSMNVPAAFLFLTPSLLLQVPGYKLSLQYSTAATRTSGSVTA
jgi:hypothetical protein